MNVTAGVKYKDLPIVEKENSSFNGWYLNDELITTNSIIPYDETISLIAHYNNSTNAKAVITDNSMYMLTTDINLDNNLYKLNNETISVIYTVPKDVYHDTKNIPWYNDNDDITKLEINKS